MNRLRLPAVVAVLALGLSGCALAPPGSALGTASPSASADIRVEPELAEELMRDALPSAADAVEVYETAGLDGPSFASDWSVVDHDARRVTRVLRDWQTPGWADPSLGAGYLFGVEIVLMESADAAGAAYNEIAAATRHPYSHESEDGAARSDYRPLETPSGRWPFGTVEQWREQTWAGGRARCRVDRLLPVGAVHPRRRHLGRARQRLRGGARRVRRPGRAGPHRVARRPADPPGRARAVRNPRLGG